MNFGFDELTAAQSGFQRSATGERETWLPDSRLSKPAVSDPNLTPASDLGAGAAGSRRQALRRTDGTPRGLGGPAPVAVPHARPVLGERIAGAQSWIAAKLQ